MSAVSIIIPIHCYIDPCTVVWWPRVAIRYSWCV